MTNLRTDEIVFFRNLTKIGTFVLTKIKQFTVYDVSPVLETLGEFTVKVLLL